MTESMAPNVTLGVARAWLLDHVEVGVHCPVCTQMAKIYKRSMPSHTARALIKMYREVGTDWVHMPTLLKGNRADEAKARYWGLIERLDMERPDGSSRNGWWRLTDKGVDYVRGILRIQRQAVIYDGQLLGFEGEMVGIRDALGRKFHYDELMRGEG